MKIWGIQYSVHGEDFDYLAGFATNDVEINSFVSQISSQSSNCEIIVRLFTSGIWGSENGIMYIVRNGKIEKTIVLH